MMSFSSVKDKDATILEFKAKLAKFESVFSWLKATKAEMVVTVKAWTLKAARSCCTSAVVDQIV
jgi:hypothetical protein